METTILIARILGVIYLSFCLGVLINWKKYQAVISDLLDNTGYMLFGGFLASALGVYLVSIHNFWTDDWTVLITIIGWIGLIKGIFLLAFPSDMKWYRPFIMASYSRWLILIVAGGLGILFTYYGFIA